MRMPTANVTCSVAARAQRVRWVFALIAVSSWSFCLAARAQDSAASSHDPWASHFVLSLSAGLGTPTGLLGGEVQYNPLKYVGVAGGVGANTDGVQVMLAIRPRFPASSHLAFTAGAGWSMGRDDQVEEPLLYIDGPYPPTFVRHYDLAHWINWDLAGCGKTG
jgi:hypothetical protein